MEHDVVTLEELWIRYWANGGAGDEQELDAYLHGALQPDAFDVVIIGWAVEDLVGH